MFPIFREDAENGAKIFVALIIGIAVAGGLMIAVSADGSSNVESFVPFFFIFFLPGLMAAKRRRVRRTYQYRHDATKAKHGLDGADMYTLIDRMVDDLDDDEAAYLRRRLDDRERGLQRQETEQSLADLLDQREADRYRDSR
ncbi:MAG: hypothetical protein H6671_10185 [Anaerolineaceae bacterium]|nr:hypothetical protein [Anaerolineaceae bacterium]